MRHALEFAGLGDTSVPTTRPVPANVKLNRSAPLGEVQLRTTSSPSSAISMSGILVFDPKDHVSAAISCKTALATALLDGPHQPSCSLPRPLRTFARSDCGSLSASSGNGRAVTPV